ncbi:adenine deaminase [Klebsiella pneumoniae]
MSSNAQVRRRAVQAARGESPFDLLLIDAQIVDMATGEIRPADVGIVGEMIASVHPRGSREDAHEVRSLAGGYLSPGLMDTHVHLESSHLPPERYAEIVLTQGTTAVFWDPHELANVLGVAGVRYAVDASRHLPLQVMVAAPSSVPSTPGLEMSGADFAGAEMETMLGWPEVRGVAEVMDMHGVLHGSERMQEIVQAGLNSGKLIEGHARGLSGARFTQWGEVEVQVRDGKVQLPAGFSLIWVKHRHGRHQATPQIALLEGWGELRGAIATSYSHDSHNLVVLGRDANDMALAANQLIASGGGMALAQQGEILAHVAMPIAGMLSDLPAAELARQFRELRDLSSQVADWEPPYRVFKAIEGTCLACNAGPHLTDLGLTDGGSRQIVDPLIACREIPEPTDHNNNPQGA